MNWMFMSHYASFAVNRRKYCFFEFNQLVPKTSRLERSAIVRGMFLQSSAPLHSCTASTAPHLCILALPPQLCTSAAPLPLHSYIPMLHTLQRGQYTHCTFHHITEAQIHTSDNVSFTGASTPSKAPAPLHLQRLCTSASAEALHLCIRRGSAPPHPQTLDSALCICNLCMCRPSCKLCRPPHLLHLHMHSHILHALHLRICRGSAPPHLCICRSSAPLHPHDLRTLRTLCKLRTTSALLHLCMRHTSASAAPLPLQSLCTSTSA